MDHQTEYNKKMKLSRRKKRSFKVDDYVTIKIDKVDKTTRPHPNTILDKITIAIDLEESGNCAKVVTKFGKKSPYVSRNRLNKCTKTRSF